MASNMKGAAKSLTFAGSQCSIGIDPHWSKTAPRELAFNKPKVLGQGTSHQVSLAEGVVYKVSIDSHCPDRRLDYYQNIQLPHFAVKPFSKPSLPKHPSLNSSHIMPPSVTLTAAGISSDISAIAGMPTSHPVCIVFSPWFAQTVLRAITGLKDLEEHQD